MAAVERGDPRVRALIESVADTVGEQVAAVTGDVQAVIEAAIPGLQADDSSLLEASIGENAGDFGEGHSVAEFVELPDEVVRRLSVSVRRVNQSPPRSS
jgi:hypothetical protein